MDDKRFIIFRYIVISISLFLLILIISIQNKNLKTEEEVVQKNENNLTEEKLIDIAKIYVTNKQDVYGDLLKEKDFEFRIDTDDLVNEKLIDNNDEFKGYIKVVNDDFSFVKTENMLIDNISDKDYSVGFNDEKDLYDLKYIYVGSDPKNYIKYNDKMYRIIGITNNNELKLIDTENTIEDYYGLSGDINYLQVGEEKDIQGRKGIFYVGYVSSKNTEINQIMKNEKRNNTYTVNNPKLYYYYSYPNVSDVINASSKCTYSSVTDIKKEKCDSYLINMLNNTYLSNSAEKNMIYMINDKGELTTSDLIKDFSIKKVIYVSGLSKYKSGNGTKENPFEFE